MNNHTLKTTTLHNTHRPSSLAPQGIAYVLNFDMATSVETYVHRIGRTGRAGLSGRVGAFVVCV